MEGIDVLPEEFLTHLNHSIPLTSLQTISCKSSGGGVPTLLASKSRRKRAGNGVPTCVQIETGAREDPTLHASKSRGTREGAEIKLLAPDEENIRCRNCEIMGHYSHECKEPKKTNEKAKVERWGGVEDIPSSESKSRQTRFKKKLNRAPCALSPVTRAVLTLNRISSLDTGGFWKTVFRAAALSSRWMVSILNAGSDFQCWRAPIRRSMVCLGSPSPFDSGTVFYGRIAIIRRIYDRDILPRAGTDPVRAQICFAFDTVKNKLIISVWNEKVIWN